jgi:hypothetical protein
MWRQGSLLRGWLGRSNLKMTIDGHRIATDHFTGELLRQSDCQARFARTCRSQDDHQERFRLSRRQGAHSTRAPGNGPAETEECQREDEDHQREKTDNLHALARMISRFPICVMHARIGVRLWYRLLARGHSPILRVAAIPYRPFAGCSRNENAMPDKGRDIPTARERTGSMRLFHPRRHDPATRPPTLQ